MQRRFYAARSDAFPLPPSSLGWGLSHGAQAKVKILLDEYSNIRCAAESGTVDENKDFLFRYNPELLDPPNFNQPVYLGKLLSKPNAANSPEWVYVVFPGRMVDYVTVGVDKGITVVFRDGTAVQI